MKGFIRLAILCSIAAWPTGSLASFIYDISFNDPGSVNAGFYSEIQSNLGAALADWSRFFVSDSSLQVEVVFDSGIPRASAASVSNALGRAGIASAATSVRRAFTLTSTIAAPTSIIALWIAWTTPQPMK